MLKNLRNLGVFLTILAFASCKNQQGESYSEAEITKASEELNQYFEEQFEVDVQESPMMQTQLGRKTNYGQWDDFSHLRHADELKEARKRKEYLENIDPNSLNKETNLSYQLYKRQIDNEIEDYDYRFYDYPVNQMFGYHSSLPAFLINNHRIDSVADAKAYISRLKGFSKAFEQVIGGIKIREQNGIIPPKFVFAKVLEDSQNIIKGKPFEKSENASTLLADFKEKIDKLEIDEDQKVKLISEAEQALVEYVKPAYLWLIKLLETQQKRATSDDGAWKFPNGDKFYELALKRTTTTNMTAQEIHEYGLSEVTRIHGEMEKIMKEVEFEGSLQDFFDFMRNDEQFYYENTPKAKEQYLTDAKGIIDEMRGSLDELFLTKPKAKIKVKAVEAFREKSAGKAFYQQPAPDGSRPGIFYVNLYDMKAMPTYQLEALAYHEGIPGHHMQIAIAQELKDIPQFRKFGGYGAYVEGWGLYSEYLPKEIGFYKDSYADFGRLAMELWRACRLVVDTGIHHKKWSREEGIEFYKKNTPNAESDCVKMVERHIVMPGQATAYKIGMKKILDLREKAKSALGEDFNIKEFHDAVLLDGALPLDVLESKIDNWIEENK
ncbi:DUF885 domain-containing protein [Zunongwangia sp. SCSIO 43204]|uniref:DUF885 domain-containing protein n=1 Tax=Zunongwangia sp. SCSIO 43204 TaxID=2779359 RepID=UPI001CA954CB|nr:DUF885 domain-containing protein [Zunongwangia sp. SCSIO 43204]UAB83905.1 DUF885 domain-containing protein [Zunongwangia sp. SCSIO 43204]